MRPCRWRRCCRRPADIIGSADNARHPNIPLPRDLFAPQRHNSRGIEFGERAALEQAGRRRSRRETTDPRAGSRPTATHGAKPMRRCCGRARRLHGLEPDAGRDARATMLERAADLLEQRARAFHRAAATRGRQDAGRCALGSPRGRRFLPLLCRARAAKLFGDGKAMPGPTGESNVLALRGRGVFVAISPWNFPLAIFLGQVTAALMAGNAVVAKPAEQTPLIAARGGAAAASRPACRHVRAASGAGRRPHRRGAGRRIPISPASSSPARPRWRASINRTLAAKDGPIVPLIAETGGINAMIVDATALPEQVADDVVTSAFRSAGQRCSALRLLFVQDDVADRMIEMIAGAARELRIGDPSDPATHIGPVIDAEAKQRLDAHIARMKQRGAGAFRGHRARRQLRRAAYFRTGRCRPTDRGSVRPGAACGALPRRPPRRACCNRSSAPATG